MGPISVGFGRSLSPYPKRMSVPTAVATKLLEGASNRVGISIALLYDDNWQPDQGIILGPLIEGSVLPISSLNLYNTACYVDVAHLGPLIGAAWYALSNLADTATLGVVDVQLNHPVPTE